MRTQSISVALAIVLLCPFASAQWVQLGLADSRIEHIAVGSSGIFAVTSTSSDLWGSMFRTTDGGMTWLQIVSPRIADIAVAPDGAIYMAKDSLYRSSDGGTTWSNLRVAEHTLPAPADGPSVQHVAVGPTGNVFCGLHSGVGAVRWNGTDALALSTDAGLSWTFLGWDTLAGSAIAFKGDFVLTMGESPSHSELYLSPDKGQTWKHKGDPTGASPLAFCSNGNLITRGGRWGPDSVWLYGIFLSADTGASWLPINSPDPTALIALPNGNVLVGTDTAGIYLFSDNGDSLKTLNEGLTDLHVHTFTMDNAGYVYAGTNKGVWRRPIYQLVSVSQPPEFPKAFRLEQNYPNPFNPTTTIKYELPKASHVSLTVYDILGREISVLVNERREAGYHEARFDGSGLASGVYFYRLEAGDFVQTRKLLLLR